MTGNEYWQECISDAAEECGVALSPDQLALIARAVEGAHENYGMAFYSPPSSDRYAEIERESLRRLNSLEREFESHKKNASTAIKQALGLRQDDIVSIGEYGEVTRFGGRTERVQ